MASTGCTSFQRLAASAAWAVTVARSLPRDAMTPDVLSISVTDVMMPEGGWHLEQRIRDNGSGPKRITCWHSSDYCDYGLFRISIVPKT